MFANVVFVIRCLYSAVSLTLVREQRFIRIIYYGHYFYDQFLPRVERDRAVSVTADVYGLVAVVIDLVLIGLMTI